MAIGFKVSSVAGSCRRRDFPPSQIHLLGYGRFERSVPKLQYNPRCISKLISLEPTERNIIPTGLVPIILRKEFVPVDGVVSESSLFDNSPVSGTSVSYGTATSIRFEAGESPFCKYNLNLPDDSVNGTFERVASVISEC